MNMNDQEKNKTQMSSQQRWAKRTLALAMRLLTEGKRGSPEWMDAISMIANVFDAAPEFFPATGLFLRSI